MDQTRAGRSAGSSIDDVNYCTGASNRAESRGFRFDPASHIVQADYPGKAVRVELYGADGAKTFSETLFPRSGGLRLELPVDKLKKGRYLLKMSAGGGSETRGFDWVE